MNFKITCPNCSAKLTVKEALVGKTVPCPGCKVAFEIPSPQESKTSPDPDITSSESEDYFDRLDFENEPSSPDESDFDQLPTLPVKRTTPKTPKVVDQTPVAVMEAPPPETSWRSLGQTTWLFFGSAGMSALLLGFIAGYFSFASSATVSGKQSETATVSDKQSKSPADSGKQSKTSKEVGEIQSALRNMDRLLKEGKDDEFLNAFGPTEELRKRKWAEGANQAPPKVPRDALRFFIKCAADQDPQLDASLSSAKFFITSLGQKLSGPGYDGDVTAAIKAAIADIEQGRIKEFMSNMFPPDALPTILHNGRGDSPASFVDQDSAVMVLMLQDLKALLVTTPRIQENVAEFTLSPVVYPQKQAARVRPGAERYPLRDRIIRFSLINGRWRFYDDGSFRRSGAIEESVAFLKLERSGDSWRLVDYP